MQYSQLSYGQRICNEQASLNKQDLEYFSYATIMTFQWELRNFQENLKASVFLSAWFELPLSQVNIASKSRVAALVPLMRVPQWQGMTNNSSLTLQPQSRHNQ